MVANLRRSDLLKRNNWVGNLSVPLSLKANVIPEGTAVVIKFGTSPATHTVSPVKQTNWFDVLLSYEPEDKVISGGSKDMSEQLTEDQLRKSSSSKKKL